MSHNSSLLLQRACCYLHGDKTMWVQVSCLENGKTLLRIMKMTQVPSQTQYTLVRWCIPECFIEIVCHFALPLLLGDIFWYLTLQWPARPRTGRHPQQREDTKSPETLAHTQTYSYTPTASVTCTLNLWPSAGLCWFRSGLTCTLWDTWTFLQLGAVLCQQRS